MMTRHSRGLVPILQIALIILLSLMLASILSFEITRTAAALRRDAAATLSVTRSIAATGYVFRDETVLESVDNGAISYAVADGAPVRAGDALALVYADGGNTGTRARAAEITAELEHLRSLDDPAVLPDYYGAYESLMRSLSAGAVLGTEGARATLDAALDRYAARHEESETRAARIAALQAEFDALIENDRHATDSVTAPTDGVFYRTADGYETALSTAAVETLTPGGLRALLASPQSTAPAIGKLMLGGTWYLAVPLPEARTEAFAAGNSYTVSVTRTGESLVLLLERITTPDTDGEVLLIFRAEGISSPADLARSEDIAITAATVSGIWVPRLALREENDTYGVFVDVEGVAVYRKITPLLMENGYCLAAITAEEGYLQEGERMLVTPRRIYEGKPL